MSMAIDAKDILKKAAKGSKKTYAISLDEMVMEAFKKECEKQRAKYSPIIEELIKEFLESSNKKK